MTQDFKEIFKTLKPVFQKHTSKLVVKKDSPGYYELWTGKPVELAGRKFDELFFASIAIKKNFVGFYYFPIYTNPEIKKDLPPGLLKLLSGKSCFHVKKLDDNLLKDIESALEFGYRFYSKKGFI